MDIEIEDHGGLAIVQPLTAAALEWIADHTTEETTWLGGGLVVEHEYLDALVDGMEADGLEVAT